MKKLIHSMKFFDWFDGTKHTIHIYKVDEHYQVKVDGSFWCDCERWAEVEPEVKEILELYKWRLIPRI